MKELFQILPLVVLIFGAAVMIRRGMRTRADDTHNKARGGGADSHHIGPD
jgi:hypothetical protein